MTACNICGGQKFETGPLGRLSENGMHPCCSQCKSLERHRAMRALFLRIDRERFLSPLKALQFSWDPSLEKKWFKSCTESYFGGTNSMDLQDLPLADGSQDFIFLSHIIEFVKDDIAAFRNLSRVLSAKGILVICFTHTGQRTERSWPDGNGPHGAFHRYGSSRFSYFDAAGHSLTPLEVVTLDPVTHVPLVFDIFTRNMELAEHLMGLSRRTVSLGYRCEFDSSP